MTMTPEELVEKMAIESWSNEMHTGLFPKGKDSFWHKKARLHLKVVLSAIKSGEIVTGSQYNSYAILTPSFARLEEEK